jgi:hypothetical protein
MNYWKYDGYRNSYLRTMWVTLAMLAVALILPRFIPSALAQHRYRVLFGVRPFTLTVQYEVDGVQRTASCFLEGKHKTLGAEVTVAVDPSKPTQCWPILEEWAS